LIFSFFGINFTVKYKNFFLQKNILDIIGNTPIVKPQKIAQNSCGETYFRPPYWKPNRFPFMELVIIWYYYPTPLLTCYRITLKEPQIPELTEDDMPVV
jgi:hypothetical protein